MNHSYIMNDDSITLMNLSTGNTVTMYSDDDRFKSFSDLVASGDYDSAEKLADKKAAMLKYTGMSSDGQLVVKLDDGALTYTLEGYAKDAIFGNGLATRMVKMAEQGFNLQPLVNFLRNLLQNPSKQSFDELYLFLEASQLPITEDGCFIAYKIVQNDYLDIYSKTIDNSIGKTVQVQRNTVDDIRTNTCSYGLHFCSKDYLPHYGSSVRDNDRCLLIKINPADVVSIPSDYNNAKGRCCKYVVVGEIQDDSWRGFLASRDYTDSAVVAEDGGEFDDDDDFYVDEDDAEFDEMAALYEDIVDSGYDFTLTNNQWRSLDTGRFVSRATVMDSTGKSLTELFDIETYLEDNTQS
jgi:hypothetical protein